MNYKGIKDRIHTCLFCFKGFTKIRYGKTSLPKYCNLRCQHDHRKQQSSKKFDLGLITSSEAQRRILTERYGYKCSECSISNWNNKPLMLQVDHIDGNPDNNKSVNLRLMCPNCHSQTPTYKGGNKKKPKQDSRSIRHRKIYHRQRAEGSNQLSYRPTFYP